MPARQCNFYKHNNNTVIHLKQKPDDVTLVLWNPRMSFFLPKDVPFFPNYIWLLMHYLGLFSNKKFGLALLYKKNKLIHRTLITPKYFRFPFMAKEDIQVGDLWTDSKYRNFGLATTALQAIVQLHSVDTNASIWYVTEGNNIPSVHTALKNNFQLYGTGEKISVFGVALFGRYTINMLT